jgi:NADPH-dependent curcumin reductase CurA
LARDYIQRQPEMLKEMTSWLLEKKIRYDETIIEGFQNLPKALNALFHGKNTGKLVVKV